MPLFREYIAPLLIVLVFLISLLAVSARIFLPTDMAAPAPIEEISPQDKQALNLNPKNIAGVPVAFRAVLPSLSVDQVL